jgi:hypothetical protein
MSEARKLTGITAAYSSGLLTGTGAETVYDTTVTIQFAIGGKMGTAKTAVTDGVTPTTDYNTGAAFTALAAETGTVFVWGLTSGGTVKLMQGSVTEVNGGVTTTAGSFDVYPQFPVIPDDVCPFAYTIVKTAPSASAWTIGTSNWNASGVSVAHVNISQLPDRPQAS